MKAIKPPKGKSCPRTVRLDPLTSATFTHWLLNPATVTVSLSAFTSQQQTDMDEVTLFVVVYVRRLTGSLTSQKVFETVTRHFFSSVVGWNGCSFHHNNKQQTVDYFFCYNVTLPKCVDQGLTAQFNLFFFSMPWPSAFICVVASKVQMQFCELSLRRVSQPCHAALWRAPIEEWLANISPSSGFTSSSCRQCSTRVCCWCVL